MSRTVPRLLRHLIDDAAIFPPGELPLASAVTQHVDYRRTEASGLVGPLIVRAELVPTVAGLIDSDRLEHPLDLIAITRPPGVGELVREANLHPQLRLVGIELFVAADVDAIDQLAARLEELRRVSDLSDRCRVAIELPRFGSEGCTLAAWTAAVESVARHGFDLKFRLGGTSADAFPDEGEVAQAISASVAKNLPFKCTAGLHRALRHRDPRTGFEHHGFLNILLATAVAERGGDEAEIIDALTLRDEKAMVARVLGLDRDHAHSVREHFLSYGSCSVTEPLDDLVTLGLMCVDDAKDQP